MDLCSPSEVKRLLESRSLSPRKALGQNFLINPSVPLMIAERSYEAARAASGDAPLGVLEIGPGVGALTARLADYYDRVVAVEIDRGLADLFTETFADHENVELVCEDFMKLDFPQLISESFSDILAAGGSVSVCANLPYYITSPVIMKILDSFPPCGRVPLASITVMIQTEVANRLCAAAGSSDYGAITAAVALKAGVRKYFTVSPGSFYPPPKVTSSVIGIVPHGGIREIFDGCPPGDPECESFFRSVTEVISASFAQRRKTLVNALSSVYGKDKIRSALSALGLREDVRGEKLSASDFCKLTYELER